MVTIKVDYSIFLNTRGRPASCGLMPHLIRFAKQKAFTVQTVKALA
jgi:hypothetical protein